MSEQANQCCAGWKKDCEQVKLVAPPTNPCQATSSCCQRRCIIQQLANKTFKVCESVFLDNDFDLEIGQKWVPDATPPTDDGPAMSTRYTGSSKSPSRSSKYSSGSPSSKSPTQCCEQVNSFVLPSKKLLGGALEVDIELCPFFDLRCNTCNDYMLFGCPRTTCQAISAVGIGAYISDRDYLSSGEVCVVLGDKCDGSGCNEDKTACDIASGTGNGTSKTGLFRYYFTYALTWQQAAGSFQVLINMCGLPIQFIGLFNGDPCINLQGAGQSPLLDVSAKIGAAIADRINALGQDDLEKKFDERINTLTGLLAGGDFSDKLLQGLEGLLEEKDLVCLQNAEDQDAVIDCIKEDLSDGFELDFAANFGYSLGAASLTLVPYNPCRTSGYARREICSAQHCLDGFNRQLRTSKRRKGKKKTPGSRSRY